jgi:hypothetical protein
MKISRAFTLVVIFSICTACAENPTRAYGPIGFWNIGYQESKIADNQYFLTYRDIDVQTAVGGFARRAKELCPAGYSVSSAPGVVAGSDSATAAVPVAGAMIGTSSSARSEQNAYVTCKS